MVRLRRVLVLALGIEGIALAVAACGSFSGSDSGSADAAPEAQGQDATTDAGRALDATPAPDASSGVCAAFDASSSKPPASLVDQTCDGVAGLNLGSDTNHCGWCGHDCLGAGCDGAGHCVAPSLLQPEPPNGATANLFAVADASIYYFANEGSNPALMFRTALDGGTPSTLLAQTDAGEPVVPGIYAAVLDDRIYLRTYENLYTAPADGGALSLFFNVKQPPATIAVTKNHVFETTLSSEFHDFSKDAAQNPSIVNVSGAFDIAPTPTEKYVFFVARSGADGGVDAGSDAGDASPVWVTRASLYRYDVAKGSAQHMLDFDPFVSPQVSMMVADDQYLYFAEASNGSIMRLPVDAAPDTAATVLSQGTNRAVNGIAIDDDHVYWFDAPSGSGNRFFGLHAVNKCGGGDFEYLSSTSDNLYLPQFMRVLGPYIYFGDQSTIRRLAK